MLTQPHIQLEVWCTCMRTFFPLFSSFLLTLRLHARPPFLTDDLEAIYLETWDVYVFGESERTPEKANQR